MKTLLFSFFLLSHVSIFAQTKTDRYIEIGGWLDGVGNCKIKWTNYPTDKSGNIDTLINSKMIDSLIKTEKKESKINIINELAKDRWVLVSSFSVPGYSLSSEGTIYYYFRKTFVIENK